MMYKDRSNYTKEQWDLKRKYDKATMFFLREDFRMHATSILKRCPKGLDLDTCFDSNTEEMVIVCRCKIYGYERDAQHLPRLPAGEKLRSLRRDKRLEERL